MTKVKFDVSGSDPEKAAGGSGAQPTPGVYRCKITQCKVTKPSGKDRRIEAIYSVTSHKDFKGAQLYDYINLESEAAEWKLDQFLQAVGVATGKKRKGEFDTDDFLGMDVMVRVKGSTYNDEYRAKVGSVFQVDDAEDEDHEEFDDAEDVEDDDTEDDEDTEEVADDEEAEDAEEVADYSSLSIADLRKECAERELSPKGAKQVLIDRLTQDDENPLGF